MSIDFTKPVQTREGYRARIICTDGVHSNPSFRLWALVTNKDGNEIVYPYDLEGYFNVEDGKSRFDLINVPERVSKFVNLYERNPKALHICKTLEEAYEVRLSGWDHLGVLEYILEDGKFKESVFHPKEE